MTERGEGGCSEGAKRPYPPLDVTPVKDLFCGADQGCHRGEHSDRTYKKIHTVAEAITDPQDHTEDRSEYRINGHRF